MWVSHFVSVIMFVMIIDQWAFFVEVMNTSTYLIYEAKQQQQQQHEIVDKWKKGQNVLSAREFWLEHDLHI